MCDEKMEKLPGISEVSFNTDKFTVDQIEQGVSIKRPLDESETNNEEDQKKCKIDNEGNNVQPAISKRQMKKMQKQQIWLDKKAKRKEINKEKKEEKKNWKAKMREAGVETQKVKKKKMSDSTCKQRIVLDMSYYDMMKYKDLCKCSNQVLRCYGLNRRMENPMQLYFCSYEGKIKETMDKHNGSQLWDLKYTEESFDKVFEKDEIIYLTSDSMNVLDSIDESKVYIIGGLVDHNSCKGASLKIAENLGIAHARLPIDKYINMQSRKVLTINQVYEIISKVVSGMTWKNAFMSSLPKRKLFSAKDDSDSSLNNEQVNEENKCTTTEIKENLSKVDENCEDNINQRHEVHVEEENKCCPKIENNS